MVKPKALGKGLSVLLGSSAEGRFQSEKLYSIAVDAIIPDPEQPRKQMDEEALSSLAESIRVHGILQPLLLQTEGEKFKIVAGERRWRAALSAGLNTVPARVLDVSEETLREMSLIENIQREDLAPLEIAAALEVLIENFKLTQDEVAQKIGWNRTTVTNRLRLLALPDDVKKQLMDGKLTEGHARALLSLKTAEAIQDFAKRASDGKMTVRQLENAIRLTKEKVLEPQKEAIRVSNSGKLKRFEKSYGIGVRIDRRGDTAKVVLDRLKNIEDEQLLSAVESCLENLFFER